MDKVNKPQFSGSILSLPSKEIDLRHPILDVVEVDNIYVVMFNWSSEHLNERNVFGFSTAGDTLWRIAKPPFTLEPGDTEVYSNIAADEHRIRAYCTAGYFVWVSLKDGSVEMIPNQGRLW